MQWEVIKLSAVGYKSTSTHTSVLSLTSPPPRNLPATFETSHNLGGGDCLNDIVLGNELTYSFFFWLGEGLKRQQERRWGRHPFVNFDVGLYPLFIHSFRYIPWKKKLSDDFNFGKKVWENKTVPNFKASKLFTVQQNIAPKQLVSFNMELVHTVWGLIEFFLFWLFSRRCFCNTLRVK